jgi:hypothetical protein
MASYFARHAVDKQGSTWGDKGRGWQAWNGWGGDAGRDWVQSIMKENAMEVKAGSRHSEADMKIIRMARKASQSIAGYMEQLGDDMQDDDDDTETKSMHDMGDEFNTRQRMIVSALVEVTHEAGRFDTSAGANGAHYIPAAQNTFMAKGICCQHCYFYQPDYQCAIVDAIIDPMAVCKLWVIPQSEIMEAMPESDVIAVVEVVEPMEVDASEYAEPMEGDADESDSTAVIRTAEVSEAAKNFARQLIGMNQ